MIKSISGSDAVTVEAKYRTPYTAKLDCKLVFGTNHPIRATVADKALARRLMILPFTNPVPKSRQDPYLLDRLLEERPAILERAVQAYYRLRANNYVFAGDDRFDNDAILGITDGSAVLEDVVEQFVDTCCVDAPGQFVSTGQLYEAYRVFCQSKGVSCTEDCQPFSTRLRPVLEAKFQTTRSKRRVGGVPSNGYLGVRLLIFVRANISLEWEPQNRIRHFLGDKQLSHRTPRHRIVRSMFPVPIYIITFSSCYVKVIRDKGTEL